MKNDATIIVGSLDDSKIKKSISELVDAINDGVGNAALSFDSGMRLMQSSLDDFSTNARRTVVEIKDAFQQMGTTFNDFANAMQMATRSSSGGRGGRGGGGSSMIPAAPGTVGELQQEISNAQKLLSTYEQWSVPLQDAVNKLAEQRKVLKAMLMDTQTAANRTFSRSLGHANAMPDRTLQQAEEKLNRLRDIEQMADRTLVDPTKWQRLLKTIDRVQDKVDKLREKMNVPQTTSGVLGMSEKTLDEVERKMQAIAHVRGTLNFQTQGAEINRLNVEYNRLANLQNEALGKNLLLERSNRALASAFGYLRNRIIYALTIGSISSFVKQIYEVRGQYELLERSLGVLVNSFQKGSQIFQELSNMAIESPFTLMELAGAAKQLTAYNFTANEVVGTTKRLADISAALGVPMERLVYNLGQIRAQTVLTARDARDFANAGLPIVKSLADYYSELEGRVVSTGEVYGRMTNKMVSYADVMAVINQITDEGGKFFNFQAKQADTLKVQMANLTLAWNNMLNEIGEQHQGMLALPVKALKSLFQNWQSLDNILTDVILTFGIVKAAQIALNAVVGRGNFFIKQHVVASKQRTAAMLQQKAVVQSLSFEELRLLASTKKVTAADYELALSSKTLTKLQALMLLAFNKNNVALKAAMVNMKLLTAEEAANITISKVMGLALKSLGLSIKALGVSLLAALPVFAIGMAVSGIIQLFQSLGEQSERNAELNRGLAESAKEASDALDKFLNNKGNRAARELANQNKLTSQEGEKAWNAISEELTTSAASATNLLKNLMGIDDINERVKKGFEYAESIRKAQYAMQDLQEDTIKVSQTNIGEGLVDDLKDFADGIEKFKGNEEQLRNVLYGGYSNDVKSDFDEFKEELDVTAKSISDFIKTHNITDPLQINEILERARIQIKANNPKISGELANLFDVNLDEKMSEYFPKAIDKTASLWKIFMDTLKANSSAAFSDITEDIYSETGKLTDKQQKAVDDNLEYFKKSMPYYYDAVKNMVANASKLRIQIGLAFNVQQITDFQKEVKNRISNASGMLDFGSEAMLPTSNDDLVSWAKTQRETIQKLTEANKQYAKDNTTWAKDRIAENDKEISQRKNLLGLFNQSASSDKESAKQKREADKLKRQGESELQRALKDEISLIDKVHATYKKLVKEGVDSETAIQESIDGYDKSVTSINKTFQKFGLGELQLKKFAGVANPREIMNMLQTQLDSLVASGKAKPAEIKDLEVKIKEIKIDAISYDHKKITEGLNNELSKLKDEYELAVELDANPELGDVFANLFDIDLEALPHTFGEALHRANDIAKKELAKLGVNTPFDLMRTDLSGDTWMGIDTQSEPMQKLIQWQKSFRDMFKKNIEDTEKMLDDYVKKYGDYTDKIAEIEADRLEKVKKLNEAYYTEEMRKRPEYIAKLNAIESGAQREKGAAKFDEFKQSRLYIAMFENLDTLSQSTLMAIRKRLIELKDEMGTLSPEQLKQVTQQFEKINAELIDRNPFKGLIKNVRDYARAVGKQGKQAQKDFVQAQRNYDEQLKIVTTRKEQLEQLKAQQPWNVVIRTALEGQLSMEEEKLQKLKEELAAAEELNEKYDLMRKIFDDQASGIAKVVQIVAANLQSLGELRDTLHDMFGVDLGNELNAIIDNLGTMGEGLNQTVSSLQSGNVVGGVTGVLKTVGGLGDVIASAFGDGAARTKRINKEITKSQEEVRRLQMAYNDLERSVDKAMGNEELRARKLAIANKQAELAEIERQTRLERSKRSKDRDDETIKQNEETMQSLKNEIEDLTESITTTLLGSDIKSAAEDFVSTWVGAWRSGEDTMDALSSKFDDMIDQMIMKSVASRLVAKRLQPIWDLVEQITGEGSEGGTDITESELMRIRQLIGDKSISEAINEDLRNLYNALGVAYGSSSTTQSNLSALQQGIQGITEDQAGALEAYWNANTQQQYVHTDLLTQIRDAVVAADNDAQLGTQAQILLQLQYSYQVQTAIQNILIGWSSANGLAVRCEMV